jgi:endonuclease G, mitochondrial
MDVQEQALAAAARYRDTEQQREAITQRLDVEGYQVFDSDAQIEARATRLVESGLVPVGALLTAVQSEPSTARVVLERIIGEHNDLQPVTFLSRGAQVARTIGRVSQQRGGRLLPQGTGFLVAPRLLLTNNHVLPDVHLAAESVIEFDCDPGTPDSAYVLVATDPDRLFVTDQHLDYSLVALRDLPDGRAPGEEFGWNQLISRQGKIVTGEPINVIGHPMGRTKEVSVRNNRLINQLEHFLHYETDTEPGNSGSPVYNDTWEVVALHHAGVPSTDDDGNLLKADKQPWHPSDGNQAIHWVANEGARVSVLLAHLAELDLPAEQGQLLATLAEPSPFTVPMGRVAAVGAGPSGPEVAAREDWRLRVEGGRALPQAASRGRTGVRAAGSPYGGDVQLVFVHGRSQQGRDPVQLRNAWTAGLAKGLVAAGLPAIDAAHVWFPYYGDTLVDALPARESASTAADAEPVEALAPAAPDARRLYEALIEEAATAAGMPDELAHDDDRAGPEVTEGRMLASVVSRLQRQATWLANRSGLDDLVIARAFRDVATYLDAPETRERVLDQVLTTLPERGPVVLVCHSLGTVVGMDLLTRLPDGVAVTTLVTAGSPLGMDAVYRRLLVGGPHLPDRVGSWLNAWCAADAVAIGCPLARRWGRRVVDVSTDNPKDRAHDIDEYLADQRVARTIGTALQARH